jgi:hypothetical protein
MSVDIDPQELGFHRTSPPLPTHCDCFAYRDAGPFTVEVLENLKIKNPNTHPVAFKVGLKHAYCFALPAGVQRLIISSRSKPRHQSSMPFPATIATYPRSCRVLMDIFAQILRQTQLGPRRTGQGG